MIISHTQIQEYLDCQRKWYLRYKLGLKLDNIHTQFGSMAHEVLETHQIPPEHLYLEFKEFFGITSWANYFNTVFDDLGALLADYSLKEREVAVNYDYLQGKIDSVWYNEENDKYLILDYKFSNYPKDRLDLIVDQQPYVYAVLYSLARDIPIDKFEIGFLVIPKSGVNSPRVLSNGKLSKDKSQKTTSKIYREKIAELGLDEKDYQDILDELENRRVVSLVKDNINIDVMNSVFENIDNVYKEMITKEYYLEKQSSFSCRKCDLFDECKIKRIGVF